ncbi:MAG: hypothetical protein HYR95_01425 [Candidatus Colwellbacteria bacterium]|nr:hypothetical protein [Candidatus Colwellbacteria bacterium]
MEVLDEPIEKHVEYIRKNESGDERWLHLRLIKVVKAEVPLQVFKAWDAYCDAGDVYNEAVEALDEALVAWRKACDVRSKSWRNLWGNARRYYKAYEALVEARNIYNKAHEAYYEAQMTYGETCNTHDVEIYALHRKECIDCRWD